MSQTLDGVSSLKPTNEDFAPRRDGWFEHRGVWGEVVVGTVLANRESRSQRWEVIDTSHGEQVEYGYTLWMRIREQTSGDEHTVPPRLKTAPVNILTLDPCDVYTGEPTAPSDSEAIERVVRELGATILARRDEVTGEIVCPNYNIGENHLPGGQADLRRGEIEHLDFAHGMKVPPDSTPEERTVLHAQAHSPKFPNVGKGGFPHRHVPEDMTLFTG